MKFLMNLTFISKLLRRKRIEKEAAPQALLDEQEKDDKIYC
jgi:hypothetical protein